MSDRLVEEAAVSPPAEHDDARLALRDALLERSWQLLDLLERLGSGPAQRLLRDTLHAEARHADERLAPLERWEGLGERSHATYVGGNNHVRIARVLDFLEPGERVLDIGIGYGYLTSVLVRSGLVDHYCGIDLTERYIETAREGLRANGLAGEADVHLEVGDLYDLSEAWVADHAPSLVLLLEVLEHVPDTQAALSRLGAVLGPGVSVVFTVPMMNRLEGVWGHRSLFDRRRLTELCSGAGLTIQYVEPLHNVWTLVLATTSPEVPSRLFAAAAAAPSSEPTGAPPHDYLFGDVSLDDGGRPAEGGEGVELEKVGEGLRCRIEAGEAGDRRGLGFAANAPAVLRLQVTYDQPAGIAAMVVDGYEGTQRVARWRWPLDVKTPAQGETVVHVIKPGSGGRFARVGPVEAHRIDRVELLAELKPEAEPVAFTLDRAAYVGNLRPEDQATPSSS